MTVPWWMFAVSGVVVLYLLVICWYLLDALEEAVVTIIESGKIESIDCKKCKVKLKKDKVSTRWYVSANKVLKAAKIFHRRWLKRTLTGYAIKWALDGLRIRTVL